MLNWIKGSKSEHPLADDNAAREFIAELPLPSSANDTNGAAEMNLLLRPGAFSMQKSMEMRAYERSYLLVPRKIMEGGHDFDMARFRVMQRAA